ncbi:MAG: hypothetical protein WD768_02360 [Phycisphaeraceae bacterium]
MPQPPTTPPAPLMLSVSGLRGLIGQSLTPPVAARFAAAFGTWLRTQSKEASPRVVIGRDSRPSGEMIELAAAAGLISVGCEVIALGIATTPTTAVMVEHLKAAGGMVITASHNPIIWNGIKCLRYDGVAPPPAEANEIIRRFKEDDVSHVPVESLKAMRRDDTGSRVHIDRILPLIDVDAIRKAKLKCVLDSVHGAGGPATAQLLEELGVELVHLYGEPTGLFPHTPEPTRDNLTELAAAVAKHKAHVGFAQDPDADRLALVDERGTYIGEEYTLVLCAMHVLGAPSRQGGAESERTPAATGAPAVRVSIAPPCRDGAPVVAANLSTSRMIDDVAARFGATVVRTAVGEANVAAAMKSHHAPVGGEGNGGIIVPRVTYVRDSLTGIALTLELLATRGKPLSAIVDEIPRYAIVKDKLPFDPAVAARLVSSLKQVFSTQKIDLQDGVRIDWPDRWVHARPSNTEPIMRIIAEAPTESDANELIAKVRAALGV